MTYAEFLSAIQERVKSRLEVYLHKPFTPAVREEMTRVMRDTTNEVMKENNFPHNPRWSVSQDKYGNINISPAPIPVEVYLEKQQALFTEEALWKSKTHGDVDFNTCSEDTLKDIMNECNILLRLSPCASSQDTMETWTDVLDRVYKERFGNETKS